MSFDAIKPYLLLIKIVLGAGLLAICLAKGCSHGAAAQEAKDAKIISDKNQALARAATAMLAAGKALRAVNAEAQRRIAQDEQSKAEAISAGKVAAAAQKRLADSQKEFKLELKKARNNPTCDALLNADVEAVCGI